VVADLRQLRSLERPLVKDGLMTARHAVLLFAFRQSTSSKRRYCISTFVSMKQNLVRSLSRFARHGHQLSSNFDW
jgi:hypothetical protein